MKRIEKSNLFIVSENEIRFRNKTSKKARSVCPACGPMRDHPSDPSVAWDLESGIGYCHHCHARFKIDSNPDVFEHNYGAYRRTDEAHPTDMRSHLLPLDTETVQYLAHRGISEEVAVAAGICSRRTWRGSSWLHWVAFPFYNERGRIVNVQYKLADIQQKEFMLEPGAQLIPWNIGCIYEDRGSEPLYVTEGMIDALALMQCGYKYVVSVPNGAGSNMSVFGHYRDVIERKFSYIVFAGDTDEKGQDLADNFTKYFSTKDVCLVMWDNADRCSKDADDVLMKHGADAVRSCVGDAEMEKSRFIKMAMSNEKELDSLYENGIPTGVGIQLEGFDDIIRFQEGNLMLVTGYPGSGKSTFVNYIVMSLLRIYQWKTLFFSPEKQPQHFHEAELVSIVTGKDFGRVNVPSEEYAAAKDFIRNRIMFIEEEVSDPDFIVALAHRAVRCMGIKVLVVDPFVYLDMPMAPGVSESQKIAEVLKKLIFTTRQLKIFVILVAHPRKPSGDGPAVPSLYEVSGSASFYNFCDSGIIMERLKSGDNLVKITCGKARRPYNGALGECQLAYDVTCGRYTPCIQDKGRYTTEYRSFDRRSWVMPSDDMPASAPGGVPVQGSIDFGDSVNSNYVDPGEQ